MRWNATEIVAVRQQQDKTLPLKRPVLSAWLIQMALPLLAASCCVGHVPRAALVLLLVVVVVVVVVVGVGFVIVLIAVAWKPMRSFAFYCFNAWKTPLPLPAARRASFAPSLFVSSSFPVPVPVPVLARPSSWLSRVGGVCPVLLLLLLLFVLVLLLCNCNFQG